MQEALIFLLRAAADFFSFLFLLRLLMQACRVSFANPLGHFVVTLTHWAVEPLRRLIPGLGGLDWASLLAAFVLQLLFVVLLAGLNGLPLGAEIAPIIAAGALRNLLRIAVYLLIAVLILQAVLSWVNPHSPFAAPIDQMTRPFLTPLRRILPPISGIDLSPLIAILLLQAALILLRFDL